MNIFALDDDPTLAARAQCNSHVVKMTLESAQMLCTVAPTFVPGVDVPYRPTHRSHPCTLWAVSSVHNLAWLLVHARALADEYTRRYGRRHASAQVIELVYDAVPVGDPRLHTQFAQAMPPELRGTDPVEAYRRYYVVVKSTFARWAPRAVAPVWWPDASA